MSGRLTQAEIRELAQDLVEVRLHQSEAQQQPTAVILAGQSGAGKSTVAADLRESLMRKGGYIAVDADEMRAYLPYYDDLSPHDTNVAEMTQVDAGALANAVRDEAIKARRNVVIDGTLRDSDAAMEMAKNLRSNGYRVELHALAVNEQISYERATMRYELDRAEGRNTRYVPREWHDRSFSGMADSVRRLEYSASVDRVAVYDRIGNVLHEQNPQQGKVVSAKYLESHRAKLTDFERIDLAESWDQILESMEKRGARGVALSEAKLAAERAHYTLRMSPSAAENYDFKYPAESHNSRELGEKYGERLSTAFEDQALHAAKVMPELQGAFAAQAAARRFAREHPNVQSERFETSIRQRISQALQNGDELSVGVREQQNEREISSQELDF